MTADSPNAATDAKPGAFMSWLVALAVFAGFLAYSLIQAPVPGPNEPHYLSKAKRYWNPEFCPRDVFLDSADAHTIFYQSVGLLTTFLSLEQAAVVTRILAYALLAIGWTSCLSRLLNSRAAPLWASWVFLGLATFGNLSGEWMVGGAESKVFSYAFVLWSLGLFFDRRWLPACALAGLAVSFHPVVGVWAVLCMVYAAVLVGKSRGVGHADFPAPNDKFQRKPAMVAAGVGLLCALPGLVPALLLVVGEQHPDAARANHIQVLERLAHHLDPTKFKTIETEDFTIQAAWIGYAGLFVFWLCARRFAGTETTRAERWFFHFVVMTVLIAVAGIVVGWLPRGADGRPDVDALLFDLRVALLKFYPFRICDVFVPLAAAVGLTRLLERSATFRGATGVRGAIGGCGLFAGFLLFALVRPIPDRNPSHMKPEERAEWVAVCRWIDENTPPDAQVLTPVSSWAFKWHAQRAEYSSYKDCPQDAAGILEWRRRQNYLADWDDRYSEAFTRKALLELLKREGITHIVSREHISLFEIPPVHAGDERIKRPYRVYRLSDAESAHKAAL